MKSKNLFWAQQGRFGRRVDIYMGVSDGIETRAVKALFETCQEGAINTDPILMLTKEEGQELIDALWSAGLRPTEGSGSAGSLAATERHLQDMQRIAIGLLRKGGVPL